MGQAHNLPARLGSSLECLGCLRGLGAWKVCRAGPGLQCSLDVVTSLVTKEARVMRGEVFGRTDCDRCRSRGVGETLLDAGRSRGAGAKNPYAGLSRCKMFAARSCWTSLLPWLFFGRASKGGSKGRWWQRGNSTRAYSLLDKVFLLVEKGEAPNWQVSIRRNVGCWTPLAAEKRGQTEARECPGAVGAEWKGTWTVQCSM